MNLIFDFDGTLHMSHATYEPAFRDTLRWLREQGQTPACDMTCAEVGYWLGTSSQRMWELIVPQGSQALREACAEHMRTRILDLARRGHAQLYPQVPETLDTLRRQGHVLVLLSNCRHEYLQTFRDAFELDTWFSDLYCCEDFAWASKSEVFGTIARDLGCAAEPHESCIVIGDRYHDIDMAREHGLRSVGCAYGYGMRDELERASIIIDDVAELGEAIERLAS